MVRVPTGGKNLRIVGIHLAGASTKKSAVVRASAVFQNYVSPRHPEPEIKRLRDFVTGPLGLSPIDDDDPKSESNSSPLFWESFCPDIGPSSHRDADTRLREVLSDIGSADVFCIDAPLSLPPCMTCSCEKSSEAGCQSEVVTLMRDEWELRKQEHKGKIRPLQPYLDRFFEVHARRAFESPELGVGFEFDAVMGSGRAPLTARAIHLARELERLYPKAIILETNSPASLFGWAAKVAYNLPRSVDVKHGNEGRAARAGLFRKLEQSRIATRSAMLHQGLVDEIASHYETFCASICALSAWGFLNGDVHFIPEFVSLEKSSPLRGWACVPKETTWLGTRQH